MPGIDRKDVTAAREVAYERGLILQITLLPAELRSKGMNFVSKGRPEVQKKGLTVIELTELEEEQGRVSTVEAFINLVTVIIGAGILALPQLPTRSGWILSPLLLVISGLAVQEACKQLWKAMMAANSGKSETAKVTTYEALGEAAFGCCGRVVTVIVVNIFLLGICAAYVALIGMQLYNLSGIFDQRMWILIASPVFVFLALLPNLSVLSKFVPLGMVAACLTAGMVMNFEM
eukprot:Skav227919  [mRNA]  locus=scaffold146:165728:170016:+ [translate_table: standard]